MEKTKRRSPSTWVVFLNFFPPSPMISHCQHSSLQRLCYILARAPELKPHHQMQLSVIRDWKLLVTKENTNQKNNEGSLGMETRATRDFATDIKSCFFFLDYLSYLFKTIYLDSEFIYRIVLAKQDFVQCTAYVTSRRTKCFFHSFISDPSS